MSRIKFTKSFLIAGMEGRYRPGECVEVPDFIADQAIKQGVAVMVSAHSHPPMDKMIKHSPKMKGGQCNYD